MNRFICYRLLFVILLVAVSCKGKEEKVAKNLDVRDMEEIRQSGKIVAVTDYNSTSYFIYRGTPMGYQYELLQMLADKLDLKLEVLVNNNLDKNFEWLKKRKVDLIAVGLTITKERGEFLNFTLPYTQTRQVLVQRKPDDWRQLTKQEINISVIRNQLDMGGKTIYVEQGSSFAARLHNLSEEIGDSIHIVEVPKETEQLIKLVAMGEIDYTVSDEHVARVNQTYYPDIDVQTAISFPQYLAWGVRKESEKLLNEINEWLVQFKKTKDYRLIYNKYFHNRRSKSFVESDYYAISSGKVSAYDDLIRKYSVNIDWDWRLLAAMIYQESRFRPDVESWAGAFGIMQFMPATADRYGISRDSNIEEHIRAGVKYLKWLDERFVESIKDEEERIKFVLASYNIGLGHILDARRLAEKHGQNPDKWDVVSSFLLKKSNPKYYKDDVVKHGYCRGDETFNYVKEIMNRYHHYKNIIKDANT